MCWNPSLRGRPRPAEECWEDGGRGLQERVMNRERNLKEAQETNQHFPAAFVHPGRQVTSQSEHSQKRFYFDLVELASVCNMNVNVHNLGVLLGKQTLCHSWVNVTPGWEH